MDDRKGGSAFFGVFDPDGRHWAPDRGGAGRYQMATEAALKIALLTQQKLAIPAGYFLDNLALQRIFRNHGGERDFKDLCKDLLSVALNETALDPSIRAIDWRDVWNSGVQGKISNRHQTVYLNCLPEADAADLQAHTDVEDFKREMAARLLTSQGIDFDAYLTQLESAELRPITHRPFEFDKELRTRFLGGNELFAGLGERTYEKLHAAAQATQAAGIRISRSLLQSRTQSLDIGIPEAQIFSRSEYQSMAPMLAHYQHLAYASVLGLGTFATFQMPSVDRAATKLLRGVFGSLAQESRKHVKGGLRGIVWPLKHVSFSDIAKVRLDKKNRPRFFASLDRISELADGDDLAAYRDALHEHVRLVSGVISMSFNGISSSEVATDMAGSVYSANDPSAAAASARKVLPYFKDFALNVRKEFQLRVYFRSVDAELAGQA